MPKVTVAERILETVTTASRAASIVGDLLEEASDRSPVWFWFGVLRIFGSHVCRDLRVHWFRMIWLGISEFLGFFFAAILFAYCVHKVPYLTVPHSLGNILVIVLSICIQTLVGWHVARRSHGHELASAVALASVYCIFVLWGRPLGQLMYILFSVVMPFFALLIVGAFLCRYRVNTRNRKLLEKG